MAIATWMMFESECERLRAEQQTLRRNLCIHIDAAIPIMGYTHADSIICDYVYIHPRVIDFLEGIAHAGKGPRFPECELTIIRFFSFCSSQYNVQAVSTLNGQAALLANTYMNGVDIENIVYMLNGMHDLPSSSDQPRWWDFIHHEYDQLITYINLCIPA